MCSFFLIRLKFPFVHSLLFPSSECDGLDTATEVVDENTIDRFQGCNIVTTGGVIIGSVTNLK